MAYRRPPRREGHTPPRGSGPRPPSRPGQGQGHSQGQGHGQGQGPRPPARSARPGQARNQGPRPVPSPRPGPTLPDHPLPPSAPHGPERLQKILAHAGIGSRRACEELMLQGRVTVDGKVIRELGTRVDLAKSKVSLDGQRIQPERLVYFAVSKPKGYVSTNRDPAGRPRVVDLLPEIPQRVYTIGRLDEMSTGLMLLTNDGELANRLAHPKFGVEKLYRAVVAGLPSQEVLHKLTEGVWLAEGKVRAKRVRVTGRKGEATILEMVLAEGKNREVRRMLAQFGHKVMTLNRIAVGPITLRGLAPGQFRPLSGEEIEQLRKVAAGIAVSTTRFSEARRPAPPRRPAPAQGEGRGLKPQGSRRPEGAGPSVGPRLYTSDGPGDQGPRRRPPQGQGPRPYSSSGGRPEQRRSNASGGGYQGDGPPPRGPHSSSGGRPEQRRSNASGGGYQGDGPPPRGPHSSSGGQPEQRRSNASGGGYQGTGPPPRGPHSSSGGQPELRRSNASGGGQEGGGPPPRGPRRAPAPPLPTPPRAGTPGPVTRPSGPPPSQRRPQQQPPPPPRPAAQTPPPTRRIIGLAPDQIAPEPAQASVQGPVGPAGPRPQRPSPKPRKFPRSALGARKPRPGGKKGK